MTLQTRYYNEYLPCKNGFKEYTDLDHVCRAINGGADKDRCWARQESMYEDWLRPDCNGFLEKRDDIRYTGRYTSGGTVPAHGYDMPVPKDK